MPSKTMSVYSFIQAYAFVLITSSFLNVRITNLIETNQISVRHAFADFRVAQSVSRPVPYCDVTNL